MSETSYPFGGDRTGAYLADIPAPKPQLYPYEGDPHIMSTQLEELHDRIMAKIPDILTICHETSDPVEAIKARGVMEGLGIAAVFVTDLIREATTPLDEIQVAPARNTDPTTSHLAACTLTETGSRGKVALAFLRHRSPMSARRAVELAGITHHSSPWKRVSDLKAAGIIRPTGETEVGPRGREEELLEITDFGVGELYRAMPVQAREAAAAAFSANWENGYQSLPVWRVAGQAPERW